MIYCVEDDSNIRDLVVYALNNSSFSALGFEDSKGLFDALEKEIPNLILLDIMLPGKDGIEIIKELKSNSNYSSIPVIFLTAKSEEMDKIMGLDYGADDYLTKPFSVLELIARVKAVLRRSEKKELDEDILSIENVEIDNSKRVVKVNDEYIDLTFKEFELLYYLFKNSNIVLTREKIMEKVWGFDFEGESRTVDVHIASLRQKLKDQSHLIKTVRNIGYKVDLL